MAQESFPLLEQPMTDVQWASVTRGIGDGVLDDGGQPYELIDINNVNNTVTVRTDVNTGFAHAILRGFYHRMDANEVLSIPAVTSSTVYQIVLEYDPLRKEMPVQLKVVKSLDYSSGKDYLVLHTVQRWSNLLLSDAIFTRYRTKVAPTLNVDSFESLPNPSKMLWGTFAFVNNPSPQIFRVGNVGSNPQAWLPFSDPPWTNLGDTSNAVNHAAGGKQIQRVGRKRYMRGTFTRSNGEVYTSSADSGYLVANLAEQDRTNRTARFPVIGVTPNGVRTDTQAYVSVSADNNEVRLYMTRGSCHRIDLGYIMWEVS